MLLPSNLGLSPSGLALSSGLGPRVVLGTPPASWVGVGLSLSLSPLPPPPRLRVVVGAALVEAGGADGLAEGEREEEDGVSGVGSVLEEEKRVFVTVRVEVLSSMGMTSRGMEVEGSSGGVAVGEASAGFTLVVLVLVEVLVTVRVESRRDSSEERVGTLLGTVGSSEDVTVAESVGSKVKVMVMAPEVSLTVAVLVNRPEAELALSVAVAPGEAESTVEGEGSAGASPKMPWAVSLLTHVIPTPSVVFMGRA